MISANINNTRRKAIYRREGYRCALCDNARYIQIHHIIPRSQGGGNHPHNLIALCSDCHALAHGLDLRGLGEGDDAAAWARTERTAKIEGLLDIERDRPVDVAIVEYMSDYYACQGVVWNPWQKEGRR